MKNVPRKILLNPGPATTSDTVKLSQIVPDICPREDEFRDLMSEVRLKLLKVVNAPKEDYASVLFSGSGTLCIDSVISSLIPETKKILLLNNGNYTQRAVEVCQFYNVDYIDLKFPNNMPIDTDEILKILSIEKDIFAIYTTHHETGSGLINPIRAIGKIAAKHDLRFIVDTISSYAMLPIDISEDYIDILMSSSQKGIAAMAGLSFVIGKKSYIEDSKNYLKRSYYSNLYRQYSHFETNNEMHFTPPVQTIYSVYQALTEIEEESLDKKYIRHKKSFETLKKGMTELGFKYYVADEHSAKLLLSVIFPNDLNWSFKFIHDYCYERGFTIYPGKAINSSFRLSVFGSIDYRDIESFLTVFKAALKSKRITTPVNYN